MYAYQALSVLLRGKNTFKTQTRVKALSLFFYLCEMNINSLVSLPKEKVPLHLRKYIRSIWNLFNGHRIS